MGGRFKPKIPLWGEYGYFLKQHNGLILPFTKGGQTQKSQVKILCLVRGAKTL